MRRSGLRLLVGVSGGAGLTCLLDPWWPDRLDLPVDGDGAIATSYWAATCEEAAVPKPTLEREVSSRVCVVGGGLAGLSVALSLAERGVPSVVLESKTVGSGASGLSKGLAVPGVQIEDEDLRSMYGDRVADLIRDRTADALSLIRRRVAKHDVKCRLRETGSLSVYSTDEGDMDAAEVGRVSGSSSFESGSFDGSSFCVDPLALTRGIARAAAGGGASVFEHTSAASMERVGGKWRVQTEKGAVVADHVVLCGAAHVPRQLSAYHSLTTVPVYTWMVATAPIPGGPPVKPAEGRTDPVAVGDDKVCLNYWRASPCGERLLFGGLADSYPASTDSVVRRLRAEVARIYPGLADVPFEYVWGGTLAFGNPTTPRIGGSRGTGLWYSSGFGGHGIVPTAMAGELVAASIADPQSAEAAVLDELGPHLTPRWSGWPFSRAAAMVALGAYERMDRLRHAGWPVPRVPTPW